MIFVTIRLWIVKTQRRKPLLVIKNRIHELRNARGLTIEELAERADLSPSYISLMANGSRNISLKNLEKLATALRCTPEDLIGTAASTNSDILDIWASIPPERRDLARQVLESFSHRSQVNTPDNFSGVDSHTGRLDSVQAAKRIRNPRKKN